MDFNAIILPSPVIHVINKLVANKYKAYIVGGAVRDNLLGKYPHDYDIATNCPLEVLQSLFENCKVVGASFGVVLVNIDGMDIQIARFRSDGEYSDYRHPDSVNFTNDIMEDLKRRDFTINAIAWAPGKQLKAVPGALDDLKTRFIRAVGNPEDRFNEDPLRMMRAIRFAVQLDMFIDNNTFNAIQQKAELIQNISAERIQEELNKILLSEDPFNGIWLLHKSFLLKYILPELIDCFGVEQNKWHNADVYTHILRVIQNVPKDLVMRLTALLHDIGKPCVREVDDEGHVHFYEHDEVSAEIAQEVLTRLRYSNEIIDEVVYLVRYHMKLRNYSMMTNKQCRKLLNRHGVNRFKKLIEFRRADLIGSGTRNEDEVEQLIQSYRDKLEEVLQEKPALKLTDLAINGHDIMKVLKIGSSPVVGQIKNKLMEQVLENPKNNTREQLIQILQNTEWFT
jgi:tRNA nucleotidyltransferase (CCA-adding enzyme)